MAALWLPSDDRHTLALREPNLLVPGRKPVGPVEIDWTHPIFNSDSRVKLCCIATQGGFFDLITRSIIAVSDGTAKYDGRGIYNSATGQRAGFYFPTAFDPDDGTEGNALWMIACGTIKNYEVNDTLLSINANFSDRDCGFECGSDTEIRVGYSNQTAFNTGQNIVGQRITGSFYQPESDVLGGNARNYLMTQGGWFEHETASTLSFFGTPTNTFVLGENGANSAFSLELMIVGAGPISADLQKQLTRNIFAPLKPANSTPYLISVPTGGATVTLSSPTATATGSTTATVGCQVTYT